jgi:hypothetical protein
MRGIGKPGNRNRKTLRGTGLADDLSARFPVSLADATESARRWYVGPREIKSPPPAWLRRFETALGTSRALSRLRKAGCEREKLLVALYLYCDPRNPYREKVEAFREHFTEARILAARITTQLASLSETLEKAERYRIVRTVLDDARMKSNVHFLESIRPDQLPKRAVKRLRQFTSLSGRVQDHLTELQSTKVDFKRHASRAGETGRLDVLLAELILYIKNRTGRQHYAELSEVLTAGYRAFDLERLVEPTMIRKSLTRFQDRYPEIYWPMTTFWSSQPKEPAK